MTRSGLSFRSNLSYILSVGLFFMICDAMSFPKRRLRLWSLNAVAMRSPRPEISTSVDGFTLNSAPRRIISFIASDINAPVRLSPHPGIMLIIPAAIAAGFLSVPPNSTPTTSSSSLHCTVSEVISEAMIFRDFSSVPATLRHVWRFLHTSSA